MEAQPRYDHKCCRSSPVPRSVDREVAVSAPQRLGGDVREPGGITCHSVERATQKRTTCHHRGRCRNIGGRSGRVCRSGGAPPVETRRSAQLFRVSPRKRGVHRVSYLSSPTNGLRGISGKASEESPYSECAEHQPRRSSLRVFPDGPTRRPHATTRKRLRCCPCPGEVGNFGSC